MGLPVSGTISLSDVQDRYGGTNPISIDEYYDRTGIEPGSIISLRDFYAKLLLSKDLTGNQGLTMNTLTVRKDMRGDAARSIPTGSNPSSGQLTPSGTRYAWGDWGGDYFDNWGDFYIYDYNGGIASYIGFATMNGADGTVHGETQTHHNKTFKIKHGWVAQGIFKLDVQCADETFQFCIGVHGNLGSDSATLHVDKQYSATWGNLNYVCTTENNVKEFFYMHIVPKYISFNDGITINSSNFTANLNTSTFGSSGDDLVMWTDALTLGATMYFVKGANNTTGAMYDWVAKDIGGASFGGDLSVKFLISKGLTGAQGYNTYIMNVTKDMAGAGAGTVPANGNPSGSQLAPSGTRYEWNDWGDDFFDKWGNFYIYNPGNSTASYIGFATLNGADGEVYTETQTHHNKTFTIKHGWVTQGIFKLDVQCTDDTFQFCIGAYGNMGSDTTTLQVDKQHSATWGNLNYLCTSEGNTREFFYMHIVPKLVSFNDGITINSSNFTAKLITKAIGSSGDDLVVWTDALTLGATMYFVKGSNNTTAAAYDWVANDIGFHISLNDAFPIKFLRSKGLTGNQGYNNYTMNVTKDMGSSSSARAILNTSNPSGGQLTPSGTRYYWDDWGDDFFDVWGEFYIYDYSSGAASYIGFATLNGPDGTVYTETQTHHSKTFTIKHGWVTQGIFKLDVECIDDTFQFCVGAYGNLGSDSSTLQVDKQHSATWGNLNYLCTSEGNANEFFYVHFVPKLIDFNSGILMYPPTGANFTANLFTGNGPGVGFPNQIDYLSIYSDAITLGVTMYFVKGANSTTGAMYDWVANDIHQQR